MEESQEFDVIIIGAGLAGLTCAISLQSHNYKVLLIEKRHTVGGLCGVAQQGNYTFTLGCNDFGGGLVKILKDLDVDVDFKQVKNRFYFENGTLQFPPDIKTAFKMVGFLRDILCVIRSLKGKDEQFKSLGTLIKKKVKNKLFSEFLYSLGYAIGLEPFDVSIDVFKSAFSKEYQYKHDKSYIPVGGPQYMVDQMANKFKSLGGHIVLNSEGKISSHDKFKSVMVEDRSYRSKYLVTSSSRSDQYPEGAKTGLSISSMLLAIDNSFKYPDQFHTIAFFPKNISEWMKDIDQGRNPEEFGFHMFKNALPETNNCYTVNVYFYLPRGITSLTESEVSELENYIFNKVEEKLPGFQKAIRYKKFVSTEMYKESYGISSLVCPYVIESATEKPGNYDAIDDLYYIGNSVTPVGEHAGGAVLSGMYVSDMIHKRNHEN